MTARTHSTLLALALLLSGATLWAQPVQPCSRWLASVDSASQRILLEWSPSATTATLGYHICQGLPCLSLDTVFGRLDTLYTADTLSPTLPHRFRLHVFDSVGNVSALTPFFGSMVLQASMGECDTTALVEWSAYEGMPGGVSRYELQARFDTAPMRTLYTADSLGPCRFALAIPRTATSVMLRVVAYGSAGRSLSNSIEVRRATADTARRLGIADAWLDSTAGCIRLRLDLDTAFHASPYRLLLSRRGSPFAYLSEVADSLFADCNINPYDSIRCYQLEVADACGISSRRSQPRCLHLPTPPEPRVAAPNCLLLSDEANALFLPRVQGLKGDLYELHIYNRMGLQVFATTDPSRGWNPRATNSPQGVYAYTLRLRFINNQVSTFTGTITVVK